MWLLKRVEAGRTRGKGLTIQPVSCDYGVRETGIANQGHTPRLLSCMSSASFLFISFLFFSFLFFSFLFFSFLFFPIPSLRQIPSLPSKMLLTASSVCLYKPYLFLYFLELIPPYLPVCNI
ncbi:hypothetical protein M431DRAFT_457885 [Trichoderma harzianum CBS 226.95]|uniref:Uncharacterized protein n=1 Tax=Trichoderma harzianum CBS 226.95 TaxID=983964 RepID=A0A2T4A802_TRIHA|nr:hypothetical protein M431DRAFT_457885 [Trichoderma harzianum CBS 226.95]PTB53123.1 hypothetical protein M431DRAFT_457885 [Trichoderma harzianum CBS 226.95]